jgi:hypothetical protein
MRSIGEELHGRATPSGKARCGPAVRRAANGRSAEKVFEEASEVIKVIAVKAGHFRDGIEVLAVIRILAEGRLAQATRAGADQATVSREVLWRCMQDVAHVPRLATAGA